MTKKHNHILVLTDQPIEYDLRVKSINKLFKDELVFSIINNRYSKLSSSFSLLLIAILYPFIIYKIYLIYKFIKKEKIKSYKLFEGLKPLFKYISRAISFTIVNKNRIKASKMIYANDQIAGMVALLSYFIYNKKYIYDSHEVIPFRARKTGLIKMGYESLIEKIIIKYSIKTYVVNKAIKSFYESFYYQKNIEVRLNNFFSNKKILNQEFNKTAVLYIGALNKGRNLDKLVNLFKNYNDIEILLSISDENQKEFNNITNVRYIPFNNYQSFLEENYSSYKIYMWMSFDINIYSYRLSLPNKFFQAMAFGLPIIVSKDSYLSQIAKLHNIGIIYNESNKSELNILDKNIYIKMLGNIKIFNCKLKNKLIKI